MTGRGRLAGAAPYLFILPAVVYFLVFWIGPMLFTAGISLFRWNVLTPVTEAPFVGLANYRTLMADPTFWISVRNTLFYALNVPIVMVIAMALALLLYRPFFGRGLVRTVVFVPYATSIVALALMWRFLYTPTDYGFLNVLLGWVGIPPQPWLTGANTALPSIMLMDIWKWTGYSVVIYLVGLSSIPRVYYEAAEIDGASSWSRFWHVTLPLMRPTLLFSLVISTIGAFQVFAQVFVMTGGGPARRTEVVVHYMYNTAFSHLHMGRASAMSMLLLILIMIVVLIEIRLVRRGEDA